MAAKGGRLNLESLETRMTTVAVNLTVGASRVATPREGWGRVNHLAADGHLLRRRINEVME